MDGMLATSTDHTLLIANLIVSAITLLIVAVRR